ncbi:hypothetical protein AB6A40_004864 [Gnathostoma spinigerum]|uniref:CXXC-type zinc finger protein 1 n=1 Tax=Gnathostoma spinigerum TaxID=75299 RepID=A0ABD6EDS5_9BILA
MELGNESMNGSSGKSSSDEAPKVRRKKRTKKNSSSSSETSDSDSGRPRYCICGSGEESTFMIQCDYCSNWFHGSCLQISRAYAKRIEKFACPLCTKRDPSLETTYFKKEKIEKKKDRCGETESAPNRLGRERDSASSSAIGSRKSSVDEGCSPVHFANLEKCNNCINCFRAENCGKCSNCEIGKEPCIKRICVQSSFGKAKTIAAAVAGRSQQNISSPGPGRPRKDGRPKGSNVYLGEARSYGNASSASFGSHLREKKKRGRKKSIKTEKNPAGRPGPRSSDSLPARYANGNNDSDISYRHVGTNRTLSLEERRRRASVAYLGYRQHPEIQPEDEPRQCFGPGCINSARRNSKYCSEECGMNLARKRLRNILPSRVEDFWRDMPHATVRSLQQRAELEAQIQQLTNQTRILGSYQKEVQKYITLICNVEPTENGENESSAEMDFTMNCAVCAMEFPAKQITKHVERCFVRTERQCSYGTSTKSTVNPYNILCNEYNKSNDTYCRRLRVVCSEHYRPGLEDNLKVCGYPFVWGENECRPFSKMYTDMDQLIEKGICKRRKKHCQLHHNWAQNVLGLIDVELYNHLLKLDECFEKKRWLQANESMRGDVLSLICNRRIVHNSDDQRESSHCEMEIGTQMPNVSSQQNDSCEKALKTEDESCNQSVDAPDTNTSDCDASSRIKLEPPTEQALEPMKPS